MKTLLKYVGIILVFVGVGILAAYYLGQAQPNNMLLSALVVMIVGLFAHIFLNKYIE